MFRKTSPQTSFLDVQKVLPNVLSKNDWCYLYRDQVYPFIDEEIFRGTVSKWNGKAKYVGKEGGIHPDFYGYGKTHVARSRVSSDKTDRLDDSSENTVLWRSTDRPDNIV